MYPSDEQEDPLLALLDEPTDGEHDVTLYPESEQTDQQDDKSDEIARRLEALEEENRRLKETPPAPIYTQTPATNPTPQVSQFSGLFPSTNDDARQAAIQQFNQQFAQNPGEALFNVYMQGQKAAEEAARRNLYPVAAQNAKLAIKNFAATSGMDDDAREEFNKLVSNLSAEQLAQADPMQIDQHLEMLQQMAIGRAVLQRKHNESRKHTPPPFAGGSSRAGTPVTIKLNAAQKAAWQLGKSQGLTDKDLHELYKSGEL